MKECKYKSAEELPMILNVKQVSDYIGIAVTQVYELTRRIDFPAFKVGKRIFVPRDKFLDWIENQTREKEAVFYDDPRGVM